MSSNAIEGTARARDFQDAERNMWPGCQLARAGAGRHVHPAAVFNPSANTGQRTVAAHGLSLFIPAGAIITRPIIDVITTFTSAADTATIALHLQTANDLQTAIAIGDESTAWDAGVREVSVTLFKLTAERQLTATVAVQAQHAGKVNVHVEYFLAGA